MIEEIKNYLEVTASFSQKHQNKDWSYSCISDFILKNGKAYTADMDWIVRTDFTFAKGKTKECFTNTFNFVESIGEENFKYVEGYAYSIAIPMLHAWAVDENGWVFDPTWKDGKAYFGVEFPLDYVRKIILQRKRWGVFDAWEIGFPLLTGEHEYPIDNN